MTTTITPFEALKQALAKAGTQERFARICGVKPPTVSYWLKHRMPLPGHYVLKVEAATGISRHLLRPDFYPLEVLHAPPAWHGLDRGAAHVSFQNGSVLQPDAAPCASAMGAAA